MRPVFFLLVVLAARGAAADGGTISGKVTFAGTPPAMAELARFTAAGKPRDAACTTHEPSRAVVVSDGGVEEALVRLAVGSVPGPAAPPAQPALVDQKACLYTPRVVGIVAGQKVAFKNSDPTMHNVHTYVGDDPDVNYAQPAGAKELLVDVPVKPGDEPYHAKCDVHPWMDAYILVTDHPYFTTTGKGGTFTLAGVPPGTYTLEVWHPFLGTKTAKVTVTAGKTIEAKLPAYSAKDEKGAPR
jgi:plastocyanin